MRTRPLAILGACLLAGAAQAASPLDGERWHSRPLVVVASHAQDPTLLKLDRALQQPANREAFAER